jgi:hypothetical protein
MDFCLHKGSPVCGINFTVRLCISKYNRDYMSVYHNYIMINYVWLHVSTFKKSSSGHLNLLILTNNHHI